jgi:hypothetical protein
VSTANRRREPKNLALRIMKMRNSDSLERRVRAMIARATATVPAIKPCMIRPSSSRMTGDEQIRVRRMRRTWDTSKLISMVAG